MPAKSDSGLTTKKMLCYKLVTEESSDKRDYELSEFNIIINSKGSRPKKYMSRRGDPCPLKK